MKNLILSLTLLFVTFNVFAEEQSEIKTHASLLMAAVCLDTTARLAKKNMDVKKMKKEEVEALANQITKFCAEKTTNFLYKECYKDHVFPQDECDKIFNPIRAQI
jgi:hypothetical protein